jgi:hypothetical protein
MNLPVAVVVSALVAVVALPVASPVFAQQTVRTPPSPNSRVVWQHDGQGVEWFEVRVDGAALSMASLADRESEGVFAVPLPLLFPGLRQLVVAACNASGCAESEPLMLSVVSGPIRWPKVGQPPEVY